MMLSKKRVRGMVSVICVTTLFAAIALTSFGRYLPTYTNAGTDMTVSQLRQADALCIEAEHRRTDLVFGVALAVVFTACIVQLLSDRRLDHQ
jgi:hypothetical protein